jgi:hypothetical protein
MKKFLIIGGVLAGGLLLLTIVLAMWGVGVRNRANSLRETITAKTQANTTLFDNMWKTISQSAQVTDAQKDALKDIFTSYAQARTGSGGGASFINAVHEAIPQVDTSTFKNLQNIIVGARDSWTLNQVALVDFGREYNTLLTTFPSNILLGALGFQRIEVKIVTSSRTEAAFKSGKDDDVDLSLKKPVAVDKK